MTVDVNLWLTILIAFLHATFVVVGIYLALNVRLARLETKMDVIWHWFVKRDEGTRGR